MNEQHEPFEPDDSLSRNLHDLPDIPADPDFRAKLRSAFVAGEFAEAQQPQVRTVPVWRWLAMPIAAVLLLVAALLVNRGPGLHLVAAAGQGPIVVDAQSIDADNAAALETALRAGAQVQVPTEASLDIAYGDIAMYEIAGGTEMTLPKSPGRWFNRTVACSVKVGEVRLMTGSDFAGTTLRAYTPDGMIVVTGTLLSIQCDEGGTCVCVLEGIAQVGVDEADLEPVSPGYRKIMLKDGTREIIPVKEMHRDGVLDFESRLENRITR